MSKIQALIDERTMTSEIKWVPGHEGVRGNQEADEAAKEAAKSEGKETNIPTTTHKPLKSTRSMRIKREIMEDWNISWQSQSPDRDAKQLRQITKKPNAW